MSRPGLGRAQVVATAAEVVDRDGPRGLSVSAVARELGVRPPSIYSHVAGYDDLRAGVAALALDELADRVDRALAGLAGRDALSALVGTHRDYARRHPGRWTATAWLDGPVGAGLEAAARRHAEHLQAVLRAYPVPAEDQVHAVRLLGSLLRGFVALEAGGAFAGSAPPVAESWDRVVERVDRLLRTWGEPL